MMKHEFEALAGYEVSWEDYTKIIEPMYIATDLDKVEFIKVLDRNRFDLGRKKRRIEKKMKMIAKHLKETCTHYYDAEAGEEFQKAAEEYSKLVGAYGFITHETEIWSCFYPRLVDFFDKNYKTIKKIELV